MHGIGKHHMSHQGIESTLEFMSRQAGLLTVLAHKHARIQDGQSVDEKEEATMSCVLVVPDKAKHEEQGCSYPYMWKHLGIQVTRVNC